MVFSDGNWKKECVGWRWDGQRSLGRLRPQLAAIYLITLTAAVIIYEIFLARFLISFVLNKAAIAFDF